MPKLVIVENEMRAEPKPVEKIRRSRKPDELSPRQIDNRNKELAAFIEEHGHAIYQKAIKMQEAGSTKSFDDLMVLALHQHRLMVWISKSDRNGRGRYYVDPVTIEVHEFTEEEYQANQRKLNDEKITTREAAEEETCQS